MGDKIVFPRSSFKWRHPGSARLNCDPVWILHQLLPEALGHWQDAHVSWKEHSVSFSSPPTSLVVFSGASAPDWRATFLCGGGVSLALSMTLSYLPCFPGNLILSTAAWMRLPLRGAPCPVGSSSVSEGLSSFQRQYQIWSLIQKILQWVVCPILRGSACHMKNLKKLVETQYSGIMVHMKEIL